MKILICFIFVSMSILAYSQEEKIIKLNDGELKSSDVFVKVDTMPILYCDYNGDYLEKINQFINDNLNWPNPEIDCYGNVYVQFIVEIDGSISNVKIIRGLDSCEGYNEEAIRVIKLMDKWTPGYKDKKKVRVLLTIAVKFKI